MLQSHQIKEEPCDPRQRVVPEGNSRTLSPAIKCTCKKKRLSDPTVQHSPTDKKYRQVLVNFGLSRKKVFTLKEKDKLHNLFTSYILNEPAFSKLLKDSYVVFQEFSHKFGTWVDIDNDAFIADGTVFKAVFFPSLLERDDSNPGSIKRKINEPISQNVLKPAHLDQNVIDILSSDSELDNDSSTLPYNSINEDSKVSKKHKKSKKKKEKERIEKSESGEDEKDECFKKVKKESESLSATAVVATTKHKDHNSSHNSEILPTQQEVQVKTPVKNALSAERRPYHTNNHKYSSQYRYQTEDGYNSVYHQNTRDCGRGYVRGHGRGRGRCGWWHTPKYTTIDFVNKVKELSRKRAWSAPNFTTEEHFAGWTCKLWVNGMSYMSRNRDENQAKEMAAKKALNDLTFVNGDFQSKTS